MSRLICVWDVDGTLANHNHRASLLQKRCDICLHEPVSTEHSAPCPTCGSTESTPTQASWDAFLNPDLMAEDLPIIEALEVLQRLRELGAEIHFITGRRRRETGEVTEDWLKFKAGRKEGEILIMRDPGDENIPASEYKKKAIQRLQEQIGSDGIFLFFEDDPHVFSVYDKYGIVIRCPQGLQHFMPPSPSYSENARSI